MIRLKKTLITSIFLFLSICLYTQKIEVSWQKFLGGQGADEFNAVAKDFDGNLAFAGTNEENNKNIYFTRLSLSGEVLTEKSIDLGAEEKATCIQPTKDGGYLIGGVRKEKKTNQGFIIKLDSEGKTTDTLFFENNTTLANIVTKDHSLFWATGSIKGGYFVCHLNLDNQLFWKENFLNGEIDKAKSIYLDDEPAITVVGQKSNRVVLQKLNTNGQLLSHYPLPDTLPGLIALGDVHLLNNGNFLITGKTQESLGNIFLCETDAMGTVRWQREFGGLGIDGGMSATVTQDGHYLFTGFSESEFPGARRSKMWLQMTDRNGKFLLNQEDSFFGGKQEDRGLAVSMAYDGSIIVAGHSASGPANKQDAWVVCLKQLETIKPLEASAIVSIPRMLDENGNGSLDYGEHAHLVLEIENNSAVDIYELKASIAQNGSSPGIEFPSEIPIGYLRAKSKKEFTIPLEGVIGIANGTQTLKISFTASNPLNMAQLDVPVRTLKDISPQLTLGNHLFLNATNAKNNHFFFLDLENTGGMTAENVLVRFFPVHGVELLDSPIFSLKKIPSQASKIVYVQYRVTDQNKPVSIRCQVVPGSGVGIIDTIFQYRQMPLSGSPADLSDQLVWLSPTATELDERFDTVYHSDPVIKAVLISKTELSNRDVSIKVTSLQDAGSKIKRGLLPHWVETVEINGHYLHFIYGRTRLTDGNNQVTLKITRPKHPMLEESFALYYQQPRPNLYLLSIGVPHEDLKYTTHDAQDVVTAIASQEGTLYNNISIQLLNSKNNTRATDIRKAIKALQDLQTTNVLRPFDVIMIFASSHGEKVKHNDRPYAFELVTTKDERLGYVDNVDYQTDILEAIEGIDCIRYLFVDACNSGTIADVAGDKNTTLQSEAIIELMQSRPEMYSLLSCSRYERSYEDSTWQNGAFTEALLEVFADATQPVLGNKKIHADENNDKVTTLRETYDYLQQRVPYMIQSIICERPTVKKENGTCDLSQQPYMPDNQQSSLLPFIFLK